MSAKPDDGENCHHAKGREGEVPIGAVIVHDGRIIGEGYNQRESLKDPTAHAEMIAITQAAQSLESWRLLDCTIYVTLEPCPMCAGAIVLARIPTVIYGTTDPKAGACHSLFQITDDARLNHRAAVLGGVVRAQPGPASKELFDLARPEIRWTKLAEGMGVEAVRVETLEGFADVFTSARTRRGPFLIEFSI